MAAISVSLRDFQEVKQDDSAPFPMDEEMPASRVFNPNPPLPPPPPPPPPSTVTGTNNQRQRFTVELRPGETTIVSWKKLIRDSNKATRPSFPTEAPSGAHPALDSRIAPGATNLSADNERKDAPPSSRFSAVIEKIERLYMGQDSSDDEELDKVPDDDEYDTEDSFIDDAELDEYFEVDKSETKHNGFFVNRGKLERTNKPITSDNQAPKKRRRKEVQFRGDDGERLPTKHVKVGNVRMKAAARNAALAASKLSQLPVTSSSEHYHEVKSLPILSSTHDGLNQKKTAESPIKYEQSSLKMMNRDTSLYPMETKEVKKQKSGTTHPRESAIPVEAHSRKFLNDSNGTEVSAKIRHREKNGSNDLPDMNLSGGKHSMNVMKSSSLAGKEGSSVRSKGTMLERAIRDLEKIVVESRPPTMTAQEVDAASQGIKKRLPQEIKQKLAKVARLAQSSQGRISEELINHLMSILGHLVQLKTLKRHLKEMVELGLSAKQHKADRFQQVKKEVIEMIRARNSTIRSKAAEQQDGSEDFQEVLGPEEKAALQARYSMDEAMEDKIFYLYELYVEGMDEDRGPQSRKLYVELAELWPHGSIDSNGIKTAVNRARERKKQLYMKQKNAEKIRRKRISPTVKLEATVRGENSLIAQPRIIQDSGAQVFTSPTERSSSPMGTNQYLSSSSKTSILALHASYAERPRPEKVRGTAVTSADELIKITDGGVLKKKVKRKPESDFVEVHGHPSKLSTQQHRDKERQRPPKQLHSATIRQKQSLPSTGIPGCEQAS
ncbi:hypothetical protein H6P81_001640 [Aristolochia fimbriata]|uniref:Hpc2-related domain-containing protein n=1 Tax=Aristolochia fimbriata TaxID=158543 RepID=A0AAV7F7J7_ARIFI|nr:hypothetical protein H6P81_001640 [Aristolochia fimbriata]